MDGYGLAICGTILFLRYASNPQIYELDLYVGSIFVIAGIVIVYLKKKSRH